MKYRNPVIPGFYPDPSICRVGDTYYLVCSSFQFFPGVPLFESKDLLNWKQIGHVLTRKSQLPLKGATSNGGIYAPTIRYDRGRFYMVTTNVSHGGNFYVYTDDIYGEWSEPIYVEQDGIDPSLYFEDGRAYFMSNGSDENGVQGIVQCEINIDTGRKLTSSKCIWKGTGGRFLESPHLYKIKDAYYLMASEGGTEYGHMVVYAKGNTPYGPFENYPENPVLTNRNLGGYQIQGCGHADLVDDRNGNWWMVHLGFRQLDKWVMHHITGREVYLVPVTFNSDGWFVAGECGTTRLQMETDRISDTITQHPVDDKCFQNTTVGIDWCFLCNPNLSDYQLSDDAFLLRSNGIELSDTEGVATFIGIRQQEMNLHVACDVHTKGEEAGITLYMTPEQHYDIALRRTDKGYEVIRRMRVGDIEQVDGHILIFGDSAKLIVDCRNIDYHFFAEFEGKRFDLGAAHTKYLSSEVAGNFTGVMIGLYAQGEVCEEYSVFTDFICQNLEK